MIINVVKSVRSGQVRSYSIYGGVNPCFMNEINSSYSSGWKEKYLFNDTLNTFYLWLFGVGHMGKDHYKGYSL